MALESAADRAAYLSYFGVSALWTKSTGATSTVTVVYHPIYSDVGASVAEWVAHTSSELMGAAKLRETLTIDGTLYTITDIRPDGTGWLELQLDK